SSFTTVQSANSSDGAPNRVWLFSPRIVGVMNASERAAILALIQQRQRAALTQAGHGVLARKIRLEQGLSSRTVSGAAHLASQRVAHVVDVRYKPPPGGFYTLEVRVPPGIAPTWILGLPVQSDDDLIEAIDFSLARFFDYLHDAPLEVAFASAGPTTVVRSPEVPGMMALSEQDERTAATLETKPTAPPLTEAQWNAGMKEVTPGRAVLAATRDPDATTVISEPLSHPGTNSPSIDAVTTKTVEQRAIPGTTPRSTPSEARKPSHPKAQKERVNTVDIPAIVSSSTPTAATEPLETTIADRKVDGKDDTFHHTAQAGGFINRSSADRMINKLQAKGFTPFIQMHRDPQGRLWHFVMVGRYATSDEARRMVRSLKSEAGVKGFVTTMDPRRIQAPIPTPPPRERQLTASSVIQVTPKELPASSLDTSTDSEPDRSETRTPAPQEESAPQEKTVAAITAPPSPYSYTLQIGGFLEQNRALQQVERLKKQGYTAYSQASRNSKGDLWNFVFVGHFNGFSKARAAAKRFNTESGTRAFVTSVSTPSAAQVESLPINRLTWPSPPLTQPKQASGSVGVESTPAAADSVAEIISATEHTPLSPISTPQSEEIVIPDPQPEQARASLSATPGTRLYAIQVGSFLNRDGATSMKNDLTRSGYQPYIHIGNDQQGRPWHYVLLGRHNSR
ncbi:MAG: SPOR domain-containing protein, partial [Magnetococcales bacterium]|nr:SPOR domain-containing protein [Magnetococcales bacterium]